MKVGDLVVCSGYPAIGIIVRFWPGRAISVLFPDGKYNILCDDLEVISESR